MLYGRNEMGIAAFVSPKQRHDLGKLCFGFTVFWAYLMWAQFLVIWYGNLPEETGFLFARLWGPWRPIGSIVFLGMFVIPFFGLLGVLPKKVPFTLALFTSISLVSLWLERYLDVMPSVTREPGPVFGMPELRLDRRISGTVPALLRDLRPHLPDGLPAAGRNHAGSGTRTFTSGSHRRVRA